MHPVATEQVRHRIAMAVGVGVGEAALRMTPRAVEQALQQQQRDRVEQQRRDDLVDARHAFQPRRQHRPGETTDGTGGEPQRQRNASGQVGGVQPRHRRADRSEQELTLGTDVEVTRANATATARPVNNSGVADSSTSCSEYDERSGTMR